VRNLNQLAVRLDHYMQESIDLNHKATEKLNETATNVESINENIKSSYSNLQESIKEHENFVSETFSFIRRELGFIKDVQMWLLWHYISFSAAIFYIGTFVISTMVTSLPKLAESRASCWCSIVAGFIFERSVYTICIDFRGLEHADNAIFWTRVVLYFYLLKSIIYAWHNYVDTKQVIIDKMNNIEKLKDLMTSPAIERVIEKVIEKKIVVMSKVKMSVEKSVYFVKSSLGKTAGVEGKPQEFQTPSKVRQLWEPYVISRDEIPVFCNARNEE